MSEFVDRILLQLSDPDQLVGLLSPQGDLTHARLRALVSAVYDMPYGTIHQVRNVQVHHAEFQRPVFTPRRASGTWTQTNPSFAHTDVAYECTGDLEPIWLDISAQLDLTLVMEVDLGEVESILTREITDYATLDEFRARFRFLDLEAFMAQHSITTIEELKEAYHYLITEIHLRTPEPFNPENPANQHRFTLNVAIMIRDVVDVAATLRAAKLAQTALERTLIYRREVSTAEVRTPCAPVVIFPEAVMTGLPFTQDALRNFFAIERILVLFVTPV